MIEAVEEEIYEGVIHLTLEEEQYLHYIESHFRGVLEVAVHRILVNGVLPEMRYYHGYRLEFGYQKPALVETEEKVLVDFHGGDGWLTLKICALDNDTTLVVSGQGVLNDLFAQVVAEEIDATKIRKMVFAGLKDSIRLIFLSADTVIDSNMHGFDAGDFEHITIVGYPGSTAESFAHEQGVRFEVLSEKKG